MTKEQKLQNLVNNAKYVFSLIAERERLNSRIASSSADIEKAKLDKEIELTKLQRGAQPSLNFGDDK